MPLKKLKSLHARLFAIVLMAMLPVLLMALFMARDRYTEAKASAVAASRQMAQRYSGEGKALFDRARMLLADLAMLPETQRLDSAACSRILAAQGRMNPAYGVISLSRTDGVVIASSGPASSRRSVSGQSWFKDLLRERSFVVGAYQKPGDGEPARLPLALPVLAQDGSVLAVLSMSLDLGALAELLDDLPLPDRAAVSIVDNSGTILARFPADPNAIGQAAPEAASFLPSYLASEVETWEATGVDGVERLYFFDSLLKLQRQDIVLRIGMPREAVFAAANHGLVRDLLFIALMTGLALFSTWFCSNTFVLGQIRKLWLATKKMSEGDYGHRIGMSGSGELAELAMAFDGMANVLESKTFRLATAERKYRKIFEHSVNGIFQTTPEGRILEANSALARMLGYASPEALIRNVRDIGSQLYADPAAREEVKQHLQREGMLTGFEVPFNRFDGARIWLSIDIRSVDGQDGAAAYYEGSAADITYRKMVEEKLGRKQQELQALLDNSPALITIKDAEGRYVLENRMHQEVHGLSVSFIGKSVDDLFTPEEARRIREEDRMVLFEGKPLSFRRSFSVKGVVRHFLAAKYPLFNDAGQPYRVCSISYDISDYEQVREALRKSEKKFRTMVQTSPDLIWLLDPEGRVVESNNASRELLGYAPEELRGMHLSQLFYSEDVKDHDRELVLPQYVGQKEWSKASPALINERRQMPRSTRNLAVRLIPKGGGGAAASQRYFELSSCGLWEDMAFLGSMVVIRDITERKRVELALRESQELLAHTQAIGRIGGWTINLDTREVKWTDEMFSVLGLTKGEVANFDLDPELVAPEDQRLYTEVIRRADELGESFDVELRLARQGATQRWVRFIGRRTDADGKRLLSGSVQDITDRKNLELLRDDIDNIIRHDLKTPLNGIINLPQIIMKGANLAPHQIEYLGYIETSGKNMLRQVEMALDIMKVERGQFQYRPYPFDLLEVLRNIVKELQDAIQGKRLSIELLLEGRLADASSTFSVCAEERLCYPMFSNLVANAIEASPVGERISIALRETLGYVVSIRNLGVVPLEIRPRFFEKFVTSGKFKGTGLGTYSARLFALAQGGGIELDDSEEHATTVVVRLPLHSAPEVM